MNRLKRELGQMGDYLTIKAILTPNPRPLAGDCHHFV